MIQDKINRVNLSKRMIAYNHSQKGVPKSEKWKRNREGCNFSTADSRLKNSVATKKQWKDETFRSLMMETVIKTNERIWNSEMRKRQSETQKSLWSDPIHVAKMQKAQSRKPNGLEKEVMEFCKIEGVEWEYTGDFSFWIGGKNPDFIDRENKVALEIYGKYWHRKEDEPVRVAHFKSYGWDCIVVWDYEFREWKKMLGYSKVEGRLVRV